MSFRSIVAMLALMACLGVIGCGDHGDNTETTTPPASPEMLSAIPSSDIFLVQIPGEPDDVFRENSGTTTDGDTVADGDGDGDIDGDTDVEASGGGAATEDRKESFLSSARIHAYWLNQSLSPYLDIMERIQPYPTQTATEQQVLWQLSQPISEEETVVPQFTLTKLSDTKYSYQLNLRGTSEQSQFLSAWQGNMDHEQLSGELSSDYGEGVLNLNFSTIATVDSSQTRQGTVTLTFNNSSTDGRSITFDYKDYVAVNDDPDTPRDLIHEYHYGQNGSGYYHYQTWDNWYRRKPNGAESDTGILEMLDHNVRWVGESGGMPGGGAALVTITGQDIDDQNLDHVELLECWDRTLKRTYSITMYYWKTAPTEGNPTCSEDSISGDYDLCPFQNVFTRPSCDQ